MDPAYNYSIQHLNSTELAKNKLRQLLNEEHPRARYAYNSEFLSGMLTPVDLQQDKKDKEEANRSLWRTEKGWVYPGMRSLQESNTPLKQPHPARVEELMETWRENTLHANLFESPVDRGHYPWSRRQEDLELYKRPPEYFNDRDVMSMYIPWQTEAQDKKERKENEEDEPVAVVAGPHEFKLEPSKSREPIITKLHKMTHVVRNDLFPTAEMVVMMSREFGVPFTQQDYEDVKVLYNSNLSFSRRLYGSLDVDLCKVKLHEPLRLIVQQPLLYIRDMVFRPCYDALIRLHQVRY
uniref:Uncharacterized protein n=1 Tax=Biomphalaria glabrata TaxID=6526 RepID=A0A2C9L5S2_BIOGL